MAAVSPAYLERTPRRTQKAAIVAAALALSIAIPAAALAGKGGGSATPSWIALASVSGEPVAAAQPRLGEFVWFDSGYPTNTKNPWVSLTCYQDGALVYGEGGAPSDAFSLGGGSSQWLAAGGSATCRAELGNLYWKGGRQYYVYLAHTNFEAGG